MRLPRRPHGRHAGPRESGGVGRHAVQVLLPQERPPRPLRGYLGRAGVRILARTLVAAAVLISGLIADIGHHWLDPRTRVG